MWDDPESQAILAAAPINCPSCGEFISQFIHPEQDCGQEHLDMELHPSDRVG